MENSAKDITEFLEWKTPAEYDFKRNMQRYYEDHKEKFKTKLEEDGYENLMKDMPYKTEERSGIEEWLAYKTADSIEQINKRDRFDCDNSNTTCELTRKIYELLWNWGREGENKASRPLKSFQDNKFGGDTMNSFATTFNKYIKMKTEKLEVVSTKNIADMFFKKGVRFWEKEMGTKFWNSWNRFARNTHCIGNFVLVPYYFNGYRNGSTKDYWDLSLVLLRDKKKNDIWKFLGKYPVNWDKADFKKYINLFFLWDYVDCGGGGIEPKRLFVRKENEILPQEDKEFEEFLDNVNRRIERRSRFMVAMLQIADKKSEYKYRGEHQEEWKDWSVSGIYKLFMDEVFLNDKVYNGYGDIIKEMVVMAKTIKGKISEEEWKWLNGIIKELCKYFNIKQKVEA